MITSDSNYDMPVLVPAFKFELKPPLVVKSSIADLIIDYNLYSTKLPSDFLELRDEIDTLVKYYKSNFSKSSNERMIANSLEKIHFAVKDMSCDSSDLSSRLCNGYLVRFQKEFHNLYNRLPKKAVKPVKRQ